MALVTTVKNAVQKTNMLVSVGNALTKQFNGFNIRVRETDGYIHATDMCKVGKSKKYNDYYRLSTTQEFIHELILLTGIPADRIIQGKGGRYGGTWVHPHIAINLAQWVSPMFAVKVAGWVSRFISGDLTMATEILKNNDSENNTTTNFESRVNPDTGERLVIAETVDNDTLQQYDEHMKFMAFKRKYDNLINKQKGIIIEKDNVISDIRKIMFDQKLQIQKLMGYTESTNQMVTNTRTELGETRTELVSIGNKLTSVRKTLDNVLPQRVDIDQSDPSYPQVFILRDLDAESDEYNLYAMRCQSNSYGAQLKKLKSKYGDNIRRVLTIKQPNAVVFWNTIKKELRDTIECDNQTNWFRLVNMTKMQFKRKVIELDRKRVSP